MGLRGPKKKNRRLDALEGHPSRRNKTPEELPGEDTPNEQPTVAIRLTSPPPAPERLDADAKALWLKVAEMTVAARVLTIADLEALSVLCDTWSEYLAAKKIADREPYFTTEKGYVCQHPAVARMQASRGVLDKLWNRFGMTPAARQSVEWEIAPVESKANVTDFAKSKGS